MLSELILIHKMLKEKTNGKEYFTEFKKVLHPISWEIFQRRNHDQKLWNKVKSAESKLKNEMIKIEDVQLNNTAWLKNIIKDHGYITCPKFGIIASHCAWLIVQHSDFDKDFQKEYLGYMQLHSDQFIDENIRLLEFRVYGDNK